MSFNASSQFGVVDYVVFGATLAISAGIGIFYACTGGKQSTSSEYLLGDRRMHPVPVAMSTVASFVSAIAVTGGPSEIYTYGTMYLYYGLAIIGTSLFTAHVYLPVFYRLRLNSVYQYLELRFNRVVRLVAVITFCIQTFIYMAIVLYAPSLALSAVTGFNVWLSVGLVGAIGTFYTALGGLKAVVWTDVFQTIIMIGGILAVLIIGSVELGGFSNVWQIAKDSGRLDFLEPAKVFNFDPRERHTFWTLVMGGTVAWTATYAASQTAIQRCLAIPTLKQAQVSLWLNIPGHVIMTILTSLCGLVLYARYMHCDPLESGQITTNDQLFPLYVMDILGFLPGVPGVFVAALFSASLSTVSSGLNALALVVLEDIIKVYFRPGLGEEKGAFISRIIATVCGILCIGLAALFVSIQASDVIRITMALFSILGGPLLALFSLGMFFPWANWKGALTGFFVAFGLIGWISLGAMSYPTPSVTYPISIEGCNVTGQNTTLYTRVENWTIYEHVENATLYTSQIPDEVTERPAIAQLYSLSYMWYASVSWVIVIVVGLLVSFMTGATKRKEVDEKLIVPLLRAFCPCVPNKLQKKYTYDASMQCDDSKQNMISITSLKDAESKL